MPTSDPASTADTADLAAARSGDAAAFGRMISRHQRRVYGVLVRRMGGRDEADDVLQKACLLAWQKLDQFRGEAKFSTWLTQIALRQAASHARKRRPVTLATEATMLPIADSQPAAPDAAAAAEETARRERLVRDAIGALPEQQRDIVVLKEFDGRSYLEIAEIIGIPVGTVRSRLHRARKDLCERLRPLLAEPTPVAASD